MDRNLYWDTSHPAGDLKFGDATLAQWQARGHDRNSLIADPLFVDAARFDFQLRTDSPAFKLGFEPIDTSKIGLYGDPVWVDAPKRIARETYVPMPPPEPQPLAIEDDFDVRIEPGAIGHFEWREYSNGEYRVGPSVRIEGDGRMVSASNEIGRVPVSQWVHLESFARWAQAQMANGRCDTGQLVAP